jgi:DNA-binding IclR family transcriptional regulator
VDLDGVDRYSGAVTAIDKALQVLDVLADSPTPLGLGEVVIGSRLPKATVRRLLVNLIDQSLVLQNDEGRYEVGNGLVDRAARAMAAMNLAEEGRDALSELREHVTGTLALSRFADRSLTTVLQLDSSASTYVVSPTARAPLYATAAGKAVLAFLPEVDMRRLVPAEFASLTPRTLAGQVELGQEVVVIRQRGYALEDEEAQLGVRAIAAPIRSFVGRPIGTLTVAAAAKILSVPELVRMASFLTAAADVISQRVGGTPVTGSRRHSA